LNVITVIGLWCRPCSVQWFTVLVC